MIRVLEVIATLDPNGCERQMAALVARLSRERFAPHVCALTRGGALEAALKRAEVPVSILGKRWKYDFSVVGKIRTLIEELNSDVVHTWMFTANAFGRKAAFGVGNRSVIASEQNPDIWKPWLYRWIDRRYARRTFRIVANSRDVADYYIRKEGIAAEKISIIENGLDVDRLQPKDPESFRRRLEIPAGARIIGTAGRLAPQKAVDNLIQAFARLAAEDADLHCLIAGAGPLQSDLQKQIDTAGLSKRCRLIGYVDPVADLLANLNVFVLASDFEGSPNILQEAMAMERPSVGTDVPGTRETIRDRETGLLVPPQRPDLLAGAISALLNDEELRNVLATRGRADVLDRFSMGRMVGRYEALYEEAAAGTGND